MVNVAASATSFSARDRHGGNVAVPERERSTGRRNTDTEGGVVRGARLQKEALCAAGCGRVAAGILHIRNDP
jgi:hypothetical protein